MSFEVDGPFFLLFGTFTALWTHLADCDTVKKIHVVFVPGSWHKAPKTLRFSGVIREFLHANEMTV